MANKIQFRRDTASNWTSVNPTLSQGELGYETDTSKFKIGDGTTAWTSLSYISGYTDSDVDTHLNTSTATNGEVLSWTGTDYDWITAGGGGGSSKVAVYRDTTGGGSLTSSTSTLMNIWDTAEIEDSIYSQSAGVVTVSEAGLYLVKAKISMTGSTGSYRYTGELDIVKNSSVVVDRTTGAYIRNSSGSVNSYLNGDIVISLSVNDTVEIKIRRLSSIEGDATTVADACSLQLIKL